METIETTSGQSVHIRYGFYDEVQTGKLCRWFEVINDNEDVLAYGEGYEGWQGFELCKVDARKAANAQA